MTPKLPREHRYGIIGIMRDLAFIAAMICVTVSALWYNTLAQNERILEWAVPAGIVVALIVVVRKMEA